MMRIFLALQTLLQEGRMANLPTAMRTKLEIEGCQFETVPAAHTHELKLTDVSHTVWRDYLGWRFQGLHVEVYESTSSTQDLARRYLSGISRRAASTSRSGLVGVFSFEPSNSWTGSTGSNMGGQEKSCNFDEPPDHFTVSHINTARFFTGHDDAGRTSGA